MMREHGMDAASSNARFQAVLFRQMFRQPLTAATTPPRPWFYILQRGVQWKQGVVTCMLLYTSLLHNTTPIHCAPHPLHPPSAEYPMVGGLWLEASRQVKDALGAKRIIINISTNTYIYIYMYREREIYIHMYVCIYIYILHTHSIPNIHNNNTINYV